MEFGIVGRGIKAPTWDVTADEDTAILRIDDSDRPEFWLTVRIPRATLQLLLDMCDDIRDEATLAALEAARIPLGWDHV